MSQKPVTVVKLKKQPMEYLLLNNTNEILTDTIKTVNNAHDVTIVVDNLLLRHTIPTEPRFVTYKVKNNTIDVSSKKILNTNITNIKDIANSNWRILKRVVLSSQLRDNEKQRLIAGVGV